MRTLYVWLNIILLMSSCKESPDPSHDLISLSSVSMERELIIAENQMALMRASWSEEPSRFDRLLRDATAIDTISRSYIDNLDSHRHTYGKNQLVDSHAGHLKKLESILSDYDTGIDFDEFDVSDKIEKPAVLARYLSLQAAFLLTDALFSLNNYYGAGATDIRCWFGFPIWTRDSIKSNSEYSFSLESPLFHKLQDERFYLAIDSCILNNKPVMVNVNSSIRYSFMRVSIDSLVPGNYTIYGTLKCFPNEREVSASFKEQFEIN